MASAARVRPVELLDVPAVARIHVDTWHSAYTGLIDQSYLDSLAYEDKEAQWRQGLLSHITSSRRFLVEMNEEILGFVIVGARKPDHWKATSELYALYVSDGAQGNGLGRRLFETGMDWLRQEGHQATLIRALSANAKTIKFYQARGAQVIDEETIALNDQAYLHTILEFTLSAVR